MMAVYPPSGSGGAHMDKSISGSKKAEPKKQAVRKTQPKKQDTKTEPKKGKK